MKALSYRLSAGAKLCIRLFIAAIFAVSMLAGTTAAAPVDTTAEAAATPIYWGSYVNGAPYYPSLIDNFEADAGKRESIVFWGQPWTRGGAALGFPTAQAEVVRQRGSIPLIGWTSWDTRALGEKMVQPTYSLAQISNGAWDTYITQWALDAKAWGHPFFIRFDHEMNGNWYPWSEQLNGNHPGDYVKAWRHVVDIFRRVGATNASWVWCANVVGTTTTPLAGLYPGDNYVDWTQMDGYNWGTDKGMAWFSFDQTFGLNPWSHHDTYNELLALAPSKPMMIGETATSVNGGDPAAWIKDALLTQIPSKYSKIKALLWFNWDAGEPGVLDWPIETTPAQTAAFRQSIASSYYATNTFGSLPPGVIQPIGGTPPPPPPPPPPVTPTVRILASADTSVDSTQPSSTSGGTSTAILSNTDYLGAAYLQFDLTSLAGKTLTYVQLNILTGAYGSQVAHNVKLVGVNTWTEQSVSFNKPVAMGAWLGVLTAPSAYTWYGAQLPSSVIQAYLGGKVSLAIVSDTPGLSTFVSRRSGDGSNAPQLLLQYK